MERIRKALLFIRQVLSGVEPLHYQVALCIIITKLFR